MSERARILPADDPSSLEEAARLLREGQVVAVPTETVYGLAGNGFDESAILRVFETKERPRFDPLIFHVRADGEDPFATLLASGLVDRARLTPPAERTASALARAFWPGPLTLVLPKSDRVSALATSGLTTFAVRSPRHEAMRALLSLLPFPLVAPSANRFGRISPVTAADVDAELGERIPLILDGGRSEVGVESTIAAVRDDGSLDLLRPGGVGAEDLERVAGVPLRRRLRGGIPAACEAAEAPGALPSHYAPVKPLYLLPDRLLSLTSGMLYTFLTERGIETAPTAILFRDAVGENALFAHPRLFSRLAFQETLSESGDSREAARNLFPALRRLDASAATVLLAEPWKGAEGLGEAIRDRLERASVQDGGGSPEASPAPASELN